MNLKEVKLEEIELHSSLLDEGLSAILHTILFVRDPSTEVKPVDVACSKLGPLTYAKCGGRKGINDHVKESIKLLTNHLAPVGPNLKKSTLLLEFYDQRETQKLFIFTTTEKVAFERWHIPVRVDETTLNKTDIERQNIEKAHFMQFAREQIERTILSIIEQSSSIDHIPPTSLYQYDITCLPYGMGNERQDETLVAKLMYSPTLHSGLN
jgi:hypothetical protein